MKTVNTKRAGIAIDKTLRSYPNLTEKEIDKLEHIRSVFFKVDGSELCPATKEHIKQNKFRLISRITEALKQDDIAFSSTLIPVLKLCPSNEEL